MQKRARKILKLDHETIRPLSEMEMAPVVAGAGGTVANDGAGCSGTAFTNGCTSKPTTHR